MCTRLLEKRMCLAIRHIQEKTSWGPPQQLKGMTDSRLAFPTSIICFLHQQKQAEVVSPPLFLSSPVLSVLSGALLGKDPGPPSVPTLLSSASPFTTPTPAQSDLSSGQPPLRQSWQLVTQAEMTLW